MECQRLGQHARQALYSLASIMNTFLIALLYLIFKVYSYVRDKMNERHLVIIWVERKVLMDNQINYFPIHISDIQLK